MLRPIPREAPVTSATLLMIVEYSCLSPRRRIHGYRGYVPFALVEAGIFGDRKRLRRLPSVAQRGEALPDDLLLHGSPQSLGEGPGLEEEEGPERLDPQSVGDGP